MAITGYPSSTSVAPGEAISFHLSSDSPGQVDFTVERVGSAPVSAPYSVAVPGQAQPGGNAWEGFGWAPSDPPFTVPADWPSGLYRLTYAGQPEVLAFVVLPATAGASSKILLHISFLTPQAYNSAGGKSLYGFNSQPSGAEADRASRVSMDRPLPVGEPDRERHLIGWLESEGIGVEYCSSVDIHVNPNLLSSYECLVLAGHDEYWSKPMRDQAEHFVANGGNLIVLSGNTCYRQVRLEDGERTVVFYKYAGNDPNPDDTDTTVAFAEPPVNRPQNSLLGVGFTAGAFGGGPDGFTIRFPSHWVFEGVPAAADPAHALVPFLNYESDAAVYVDEDEGYPRVTGAEGTPLSFTVLATADLRAWAGKPGMATLGVYSRNGTVFNVATTDWVPNLGDPSLSQITRNVFARLGQRVAWDWVQIGQAGSGQVMTAVGDRLFMVTTDGRLLRRYPVEADAPWRQIGLAGDFVAIAGSPNKLFAVTRNNELYWRPASDADVLWTPAGSGTPGGTRALACTGPVLWAVDGAGKLWKTSAFAPPPSWSPAPLFVGADPTIKAMAAFSDILFASTSDDRLLRSNRDWIHESSDWAHIWHCNFSIGLGVVDGMLFVATSENLLWRLDLHGLRQP